MKKSTENILKVGLGYYYAGIGIMVIGLVKHGIESAIESHHAKKAAKEKAAE